MTNLIIANGTVVTLGKNNQVLHNHTVIITNSYITHIIPATTMLPAECQNFRYINAAGHVIMPGFINTHMHFYSTFARGLNKIQPSINFTEILQNLWWKLDKNLSTEACYYSAIIPLIESIKNGTTTLIDHHASPNAADNSLSVIAQAVEQTGLRASLCYEVSDRDGQAIAQQGIIENTNFAKNYPNSQFLHAMFGLHASFTLSNKTLAAAATAGHNANMGFHVHTAEAEADQSETQKLYGTRVVERFAAHNILGAKTICAHAVHVSDSEIDLLASTNTNVVHNPQSNVNNAVGIADIIKLTQKGVVVGLGTDAMTVNMRAEVRTALWLQKFKANNPSAGFTESMSTLLQNNATIINKIWPSLNIGTLAVGNLGDMVLLPYTPPTPFTNDNFLGHFAFGICEAPVATTIVHGKVLMHKGELELPLDVERIYAKASEHAQKLWKCF